MGFFEGPVNCLFKRGASGEYLFFPNGSSGAGYVLEGETHKNRIHRSMGKMLMAGFSIAIFHTIFVDWIAYSMMVMFIVWYYFWIKKITKGLQKSSESLKYTEFLYNFVKSIHIFILILLEVASLGFVGIGIFLLLREKEIMMPLLGIGFFGVCGLTFGYLIYLKLRMRKQNV